MGASGWRQFRAWFFQEEPCSFLGLRLWELDKNSLSEAAVSYFPPLSADLLGSGSSRSFKLSNISRGFVGHSCKLRPVVLLQAKACRLARAQVASVEHAASRLPMLTLAQVRSVSGVAHCILEWVVALHGYYWAHRAMVTARPPEFGNRHAGRTFQNFGTGIWEPSCWNIPSDSQNLA